MTPREIVDKIMVSVGVNDAPLATVSYAVHITIEALGYQVAADGTIVQLHVREWQPPGGLVRPKRYPGRRKR